MVRRLVALFLFCGLSAVSVSASAKLFFGSRESIHFVANTPIPGPDQSRLYLGHRVTMKAFLLPYYVHSNGYVLGVTGDSRKYIPLPSGPALQELQAKGLLPNPLPPARLGWLDYLVGFSLWWALLFVVGGPLLKKMVFGRADD